MKISIITAAYNAAGTIGETLESVASQRYPDVEHIVIDGASSDGTRDIIRRHVSPQVRIQSEPDRGVYDAMNKGLALASGDVVGFLNADDIYACPDVLARVAVTLADPGLDACYADLVYVDKAEAQRPVRRWTSCDYRPGLFERGWMPAHPTFFARKSVYERFGGFNLRYRLQSDFDLLMRFMAVNGIRTRYVPETWVRMRMGGMSNRSIRNVIRGNLEAYAACRANGLDVPPWFILTKVLSRVPQFLRARRTRSA
jgi:glycosyltransferase involved in cell wall biosynthesis